MMSAVPKEHPMWISCLILKGSILKNNINKEKSYHPFDTTTTKICEKILTKAKNTTKPNNDSVFVLHPFDSVEERKQS